MKRMLKKSLALILALTMVLGAAPLAGLVGLELPSLKDVFAEKAEAVTSGYYTYGASNGEATINNVNKSISGNVTIPSVLDGNLVTRINHHAFRNCSGITSITIPDSVISMGSVVFEGCSGLKGITVDENNQYYSSDECGALFNKDKTVLIQYPAGNERTEYVIPNSVTRIENDAFHNCTSLTSITIPPSVTSIGKNAFTNTGLYNDSSNWENDVLYIENFLINAKSTVSGDYSIKPGTKFLADAAFSYCKELRSITIPDSVTSIGNMAFEHCDGLTNVTIPDSVTSIGYCAFRLCARLTNATIGNGVTSIGYSAFEECKFLTSITIGNGVTSIGNNAFFWCSRLTSIYYTGDIVGWCTIDFNSRCSNPMANAEDSEYIDSWSLYINGKKIEGELVIPDGAESIGNYAFYDCFGLTSVTIPDSVTSIGDDAFYKCTGLTSITIPDSVTNIGIRAFYGCDGLTSITIPDSVTSIGDWTFRYCTGLTNITIPDSVTSIGSGAFHNCDGLTSLTIPDSVTSIGDWAFESCDGLTSLTIPDSVTSIGGGAFYGCDGLTSVTIPDGVTSIDGHTFHGCKGLTNVTIPDSVTSIGFSAFEYCTGLTSVTIPDSVTSIDHYAFSCCTSLTDVYYTGNEEQWNAISIASANSCLTNANVHYNSSSGGENPVNPEINADESESPADRTAYQGVFEDYVTAVVINGNGNWISDIIVDGNKYHIKKDLISFSEADSCLNKDVIFVVKDGEVVYFSKAEDITVKTVLGLSGDNTLDYGYLGDNSFSKNSIKLCLRIHNSIVAPDPADFVNSEEQKKNLAAIGKLDNLKVYISNVTLSSDPENIFNFSGKKSVQIPVDRYLSAGGTLTTEVPVNVNSKYKPNEYKYYAYIAGKLAFKKGEVSDTSESNLYITVCNYNLDPNKPTKSNSTTSDENNQLAKKAASELNKVQSGSNQGAISLMGSPDLVELIGSNNIKAIEEKFFAIICLTHIPKEKIQETLSDKVISNVFGVKKWFCLNTNKIQLEVAVNTEYGKIILKLTSEYPENNFNGYNLGGLGRVEYELSGKGAKKLPKDFPKTGFAGFFASVDVTAFCNAAYSFVESELKKSYNLAYGNDVNKAVDFIFGKSVNKILKFTKYGSASGLVWEALTVAGEEYKIECPVDVFVYDSAGNLVASIENNIETLSSENVEIEINGDTKYVRLFDGSYKIVYKATANGSMRVTVNEMANLDTSLRTVVIDDVPLSAGVSYSQNSDGKILEESDYALTANDGTVYNADSDTVNFHDHISNGVWYDGDSSTCTEKGWKCSICTVCNEWFKEYFDLAEHSDNDGNGYCDDCGAITAVSSFAIRKPSTTTINYGDSIILHADIDGALPDGTRIEWTADNGNFSMSVSADGTTCKISPKSNGKTVFTATVYDKDGNVISSDTQEMTAKAGLWQKIVAFFKKIFGLTKTFPEAFKGIL